MLAITIGTTKGFNEETNTFVETDGRVVTFEHSLASLSAWEFKYEKPFISEDPRTDDETRDYILMMALDELSLEDLAEFDEGNFKRINEYINAKASATWFNETKQARRSTEKYTAELIYFLMISYNIPFECQYWHLNRLMTLIKVCEVKTSKPEKQSQRQTAMDQRELNERRLAESGGTG